MDTNKNFQWEGTKYELEEVDWLPSTVPFDEKTPLIKFGGKIYLGKAIASKQPPKEGFEILSFTSCYSGQDNVVFNKFPLDGKYYADKLNVRCTGYSLEYMLKQPTAKIHSIKRRSDSVIFFVGDKIGWGNIGNYETTIDSFRINMENRLEIGYSQDKKFAEYYFVDFEKAVKLHKKEPIPYHAVQKRTFDILYDLVHPLGNPECWYVFDTKEGADEFRLMNKQVSISLNDLVNYWDGIGGEDNIKNTAMFQRFKKLFESKIK